MCKIMESPDAFIILKILHFHVVRGGGGGGGGVMQPTTLLRFLKKRIIRVKTVIMVSFRNKKIFFVVFYIKI